MAFSTLFYKEMIIISTAFLILIHVTSGHLGCPGDLVPCLNQTHCINIEQVCIDYHDCVDEQGHKICHHCEPEAVDAIACVTHIKPELVFECLSPNQICDNHQDCINNEDQQSCDIKTCPLGLWLCKNGSCIDKKHICDTHRDCTDGSDEENCWSSVCGSDKIRCSTGECLPKSKMCDGFPHCSDGSDEQNCPHLTSTTIKNSCSIPSNTFICSTSLNSICLSNDRICDGYKDCPMGDDEHNCDSKCTPKLICIANADVNCIQHPSIDQLCRCTKPGYRMVIHSSEKTTQICQDFDECNDSLGLYCSFNCANTDGSFNCTCPIGFTFDKETKTCRKINDQTKPNLLILFDNNISLFNIWNNTNDYSLQLFKTIPIEKHHHFNHIEYDPNQMFVIYYDQNQHAILCESSITLKTLILLSNITIHGFAYNANEKSLFIIENQSRTLRMYTPITCDVSAQMKMHSWIFNNHSHAIHSMEIDVYNRQFIFASQYEFLISNMSEPNSTKIVYSTDQEIKRFIYVASFKRIFWTTINKTNDRVYPVYTCDNEFKKCQDTLVTLPSAWPFAFFNDGLLYPSSLFKSLDLVQIYGKDRFSDRFLISTKEQIHSVLFLIDQQIQSSNLCLENSAIIRCKNKLCLQINSTDINCLSIDENFTSNNINLDLKNEIQSLINDDTISQIANQRKSFRYRPTNTMLFCIISLGIIVTVLAFIVKGCHKRLNKKAFDNAQRQHEQCLSPNEPNLDEFNVMVDDRVSKRRADYAREILFENPNIILLLGQSRSATTNQSVILLIQQGKER